LTLEHEIRDIEQQLEAAKKRLAAVRLARERIKIQENKLKQPINEKPKT
jgi:hypothetical protein